MHLYLDLLLEYMDGICLHVLMPLGNGKLCTYYLYFYFPQDPKGLQFGPFLIEIFSI